MTQSLVSIESIILLESSQFVVLVLPYLQVLLNLIY